MTQENDKYLALFESLHDPAILLDREGRIDSLNHAAVDFFEGLGGECHPESDDPVPPAWLSEELHAFVVGDEPSAVHQRAFETATGARHFELEFEQMLDAGGQSRGAIVIMHDITELKEAEEDIQYRSTFAGLVAEISTRFVGILPDDFDRALEEALAMVGDFTNADAAYLFQFSDTDDQFSMTHVWVSDRQDIQREDLTDLDAEAMPWWMGRLKRSEVVAVSSLDELPAEANVERSVLRSQGIEALVDVPLMYKSDVIGFMGLSSATKGRDWSQDEINLLKIVGQVFTNALQHTRSEAALAQERNLLRTLIDNLPDYIYAKDAGSRFILNNKAHVRLLRADSPAEVFGRTDYDIFPKDLANQYYADEQAVIRSGDQLVNREESVVTEEGKRRWLLTTKVPLRDNEGRPIGIVGMSRDITLRMEMAEELKSHAKLLEQANAELQTRNQELDEFTYVASHDLQEPLRKLIAFSDVLREDMKLGDEVEVERDLKTISSAARRMQTLVRDLLALSRSGRRSMEWEKVDLVECVALALDALEVSLEEEHAEITQAELPSVRGDRRLLTQLYQNLIGNAVKFHGEAAPRIEVTVEQRAEDWVLGVSDNGIGIKEEYADQIFSPFRRLHGRSEYEGTGIGLAICRKIVERHGGEIWVESGLGRGAHFKFTLSTRQGEAAT